jgi:hypothetical protein
MMQQSLTFASSQFWPIAIGFFGLGTGYFIWGGQALFDYPSTSPRDSIVRWACGVSGCRVFVNSSLTYRAVTVNTALGYKLWI